MIHKNILALIGKTPLIELSRFTEETGSLASIIAKVEYFNPAGSVKDRVALAMITRAEESGLLKLGNTIIEPTSGNTGVGLALVGAVRGYNLILTMPETMSLERRKLLTSYGARIILTSGNEGMNGAIAKAKELSQEIEGSIILQQFENSANPEIHYLTTGKEIWEDSEGRVDIFIAGVGTGGTISGIGKRLKEYNPKIKIIAVEPAVSAVLSGKKAGPHKIQGIGAGFVPGNYNSNIVDEIIPIEYDDAIHAARQLAKTEGLLTGISSGAAVFAASIVAARPENTGKNIIVLLPDTGERYLSTELFDTN